MLITRETKLYFDPPPPPLPPQKKKKKKKKELKRHEGLSLDVDVFMSRAELLHYLILSSPYKSWEMKIYL